MRKRKNQETSRIEVEFNRSDLPHVLTLSTCAEVDQIHRGQWFTLYGCEKLIFGQQSRLIKRLKYGCKGG